MGMPAIWLLALRVASRLLNCWLDYFVPDPAVGPAPPEAKTEPEAIDVIVMALILLAPIALVNASKKLK